ETEPDLVLGDSSQIQQVILNLCANAAYALKGKTGSIDISVGVATLGLADLPERDMTPGDYLVLSVADTGTGMDEEVRRRAFEPFFTTKPQGEGTGLGLSVAHGIVKSHKGGMSVSSAPGQGSVFRIYLPKAKPGTALEIEPSESVPGGSERILFVDDEELIVNASRKMLERLGYRVTAFTDGREALRQFTEDPYRFDVVLTDRFMPVMAGEDLGQALMLVRPDIPIILSTGYSDVDTIERAKALGFRGFITKPFTMLEAARIVRSVLDHKEDS
ncbi:MAG TPA: ATP-binding protein, partial [Acidobacteriota bacterium]|nr:ATP-binding protein [Acidobacteriota bacterium]